MSSSRFKTLLLWALFIPFLVSDQALADDEFAEFVVGIQRQEGVIEIEKAKVHGGGDSEASICLSRGMVTSRCSDRA